MIYADNAATTAMSETAINTMTSLIRDTYGNPSSLYGFGQKAKEVLEQAREDIAKLIGADPKEILFTSGGSEADNQAIISAAKLGEKNGKKHIISSAFEHHAVLHTLKKLEKEGFEVTLLDVHGNGIIKPEEVAAAIRGDTALVTIMYANNEIGTIEDIKGIGAVCREKGVLFHTDAVQAIGHIHIDVNEQNIDMLSASAHKFHGPKGVGFLYAKKGIKLTNLIEGGAQERGRRAGTENVPGIAGLGVAAEEAYTDFDAKIAHMRALRDRMIAGLSEIDNVIVHGMPGDEGAPHIINAAFIGVGAEVLQHTLENQGIYVSAGSACSSHKRAGSPTLTAIDAPREEME